MKIMTGKTGAPHVTSQQFRQLVEGTVGQDSYILTSGENLEPELQTNNLLKIRSGMMSHHGNLSVVELGTYDEVTIQNGTQGMKRIDLVVNRYTRNEETGVEENNWVVIQGTPAAESPSAPAYTNGNLQDGDLVADCPVFRVHLDGINVTELEKLLDVVGNIPDLTGNVVVGDSESMNGHYVWFKDQNLLINYGTFVVKNVALNQNGQWYTGSSDDIQYGEFAKAFGHLYSLTCSMSSGDWVSIIYQRAGDTGIKELAFGYGAPYSSKEFRIDYVAIGRII